MTGILVSALAGALLWTLAEYVLHRWLGHDGRTRPNLFEAEHTRHHIEGNYFAPGWKKALSAVVAVALMLPPAVGVAGSLHGSVFAVAFVAMYLGYEILHRRDHTHPGAGPWGRFLRRHHFSHHFSDSRSNHGVTSPIWDWVFGTLRPPGLIRVPEKLAMAWLLDPSSGKVRPEFDADYELVPARKT